MMRVMLYEAAQSMLIPLPMVHRFEVQRTLPPRSTAMEFDP